MSNVAFQNAKKLYGCNEKFIQVSIGTGTYLPKLNYTPCGLWSWCRLIGVLFSASSNYQMHKLLTKPKVLNQPGFYRFDIMLNQDIILDNHHTFDIMRNIFAEWIECNKNKLDELCDELIKT